MDCFARARNDGLGCLTIEVLLARSGLRSLGVFMLPLARGMLDREDDDFLRRLINSVVDQIGISPRDQLAHSLDGLRSAELRKQDQILQRLNNSRAHPLGRGRIALANIVRDGGDIAYRTRSKSELHWSKRRNAASISSSVANWRRAT